MGESNHPSCRQHDGPILTPASMSPATSADNSMCSTLGAVTSTPVPLQDDAFTFKLPLVGEIVFHRNDDEPPGEAMAPMEHMRFLRRVYFPTQDEIDGPVVRYHKLHYGDEHAEVDELDTAVCDITGVSEDDDAQAATGSRPTKFFSRLNPFKKR